MLAHQGGWDEILLVAVPIILFAGLLWLANHRAEAKLREQRAAAAAAPREPHARGSLNAGEGAHGSDQPEPS